MPGALELQPMLATSGTLPRDGQGWAFEYKWDGVRALGIGRPRFQLLSRTGGDMTGWFPDLHDLAPLLRDRDAVVDGEIVTFDAEGRPDFGLLQVRLGVTAPGGAKRAAAEQPARYLLFDLLRLDGKDLTRRPYHERRALLEGLALSGPAWETPPAHVGQGEAMLEVSRRMGLEGIVAKRVDSPYVLGRSPAWVKVRNRLRQEFVVGGWTEGQGGRRNRLGALLVGHYGSAVEPDRLVYCGKVGTGFTDATLARLEQALKAIPRAESPFESRADADLGDAHFVDPVLVAEVEFTGRTRHGILRQPSYKGLRADKSPRTVVWEQVEAPSWHAQSGADRSALAS